MTSMLKAGATVLKRQDQHTSTADTTSRGPSGPSVAAGSEQPVAPTSEPPKPLRRGTQPEVQQQTVKAIALMCLAWASFAGIDASAKYLAATYKLPTAQIIWSRFIGQFAVIILVMGLASLPHLLRSAKPTLQIGRSFLLLTSTACNFVAMQHLRLDETTTITFLTPLTVALLAGPILGEWVGWRRMIAIFVGFLGVLVAVRPGLGGVHWAVLFSFSSMFAYALFSLSTRYLAPYDPPEVTLFYSLLAGTFVFAPIALTQWMPPPTTHATILLSTIGVWAAIGHYLFILAHRFAPAATIAPFVYIAIITHSATGYVVFGDVPTVWTLAGASIVIASGLYLLHRERVRMRDAKAAAAPPPPATVSSTPLPPTTSVPL